MTPAFQLNVIDFPLLTKIDAAAESISFQIYFAVIAMAVSQEKMAGRLRDIVKLLEREEVRPRLLTEVEEFINKFPLAEFSTCPEDKLSRCPPEILEHVLQYLPPRDLKCAVLVNKKL